MKNNKINPLNVFNARQVEFLPSHFDQVEVSMTYNLTSALKRWIDKNLTNRYYIGKTVALDDDNKMSYKIKIAFEDSKELSYFLLACSHLKYHK